MRMKVVTHMALHHRPQLMTRLMTRRTLQNLLQMKTRRRRERGGVLISPAEGGEDQQSPAEGGEDQQGPARRGEGPVRVAHQDIEADRPGGAKGEDPVPVDLQEVD